MYFQLHSDQMYFPQDLENQAINMLIYGSKIRKISSSGKKTQYITIFLHEDIPIYLQYIKENKKINYIDIRRITHITSNIQDRKKYQIDCALFILISRKQLQLSFKNKQERDLWYQGLIYFINKAKILNVSSSYITAQILFNQFDLNGDKKINQKQGESFYESIKNVVPLINKLKQKDEELDFNQFHQMISQLLQKDELQKLFNLYANNFNEISIQEFQEFLIKEQKEQKDKLHEYPQIDTFNFQQFSEYIFSIQNSIFNPDKNIIDKLDQPLSHYYINSSHNTYLESDQLMGQSSVMSYIQVLLRGCRCLELDCWDGEDGIPIIYHGYTMTSKILFEDVIIAINKFAFITSVYPVILSLELHCSYKQQELLGEIMMTHFKEKLYIYEQLNQLPSPEQLKRKILIKSSGTLQDAAQLIRGNQIKTIIPAPRMSLQLTQQIILEQEPTPQEIPITIKKQRANNFQLKDLTYNKGIVHPFVRSDAYVHEHEEADEQNMVIGSGSNMKYHPKFIACVSLFNTPFQLEDNRPIWNISSLSEDKIQSLYESKQKELIKFLSKNLIRVYPKGIRVDSSNYDPYPSFLIGAQIIALNSQTTDNYLFINESKFLENDRCGYLLKPKYLRDCSLTPKDIKIPVLKLKLQVISGSELMINAIRPVNPYVEVYLKGNLIDENSQFIQKTKTIQGNSLNPQFNENMEFEICDVDQAMLIFQVFDQQQMNETKLIGQYGIPLNCVREGYRVVPLLNEKLEYIDNSFLLVRIIKEQLS